MDMNRVLCVAVVGVLLSACGSSGSQVGIVVTNGCAEPLHFGVEHRENVGLEADSTVLIEPGRSRGLAVDDEQYATVRVVAIRAGTFSALANQSVEMAGLPRDDNGDYLFTATAALCPEPPPDWAKDLDIE